MINTVVRMDEQETLAPGISGKTMSLILKQIITMIFYLDRRHYRMFFILHSAICKISLTFYYLLNRKQQIEA